MKTLIINFKVWMFRISLKLLSLIFKVSKKIRKEIYNKETGYIFNAKYQFKTRDNAVNVYVILENGKMRTGKGVVDDPDITVFYKDKETLAKIYNKSPEESLDYL